MTTVGYKAVKEKKKKNHKINKNITSNKISNTKNAPVKERSS